MKRTYEFSDDQIAALDSLSESLGCTKTDVLMNGLRLVRLVARDAQSGLKTVMNGRELVGPWSDMQMNRNEPSHA